MAKLNFGTIPRKIDLTGLQFCGLILGDHVKCGINTMFNTGSVIGVSSNIFGADYIPNFVGCFRWGGAKASVIVGTKSSKHSSKHV